MDIYIYLYIFIVYKYIYTYKDCALYLLDQYIRIYMCYTLYLFYKQDLFYSQKYAHSVSLYGAYYLFSHNSNNIQKTLLFIFYLK